MKSYLFEQRSEDTIENIRGEIIDTFKSWLPFVQVREITVDLGDTSSSEFGLNTININVVFNITRDPNSLEQVSITVTGD